MTDRPLAQPEARFIYYWLLFSLVAAIQIIPNWLLRFVPLVDYPSHLARAFITTRLSANPVFTHRFIFQFRPHPNSAIDLLLPGLIHIFPPLIAGKVLLSLTILLFLFGCHLLGKAIRRSLHYTPLLAGFFAMNWMYLYGFVNYVFAIGLFLVSLAYWYQNCMRPVSVVMMVVLFGCCFLAHLSAAAFLIVGIVSEIWLRKNNNNVVRTLLQISGVVALGFLIVAVLFPSLLEGYYWGTVRSKTAGLTTPFRSYDLWVTISIACALLLSIVLLRKSIVFHKGLLLISLVLLLLFIVTPAAYYTLGDADVRAIPVVAALLLIGASVGESRERTSTPIVMFALLFGLFAIRIGEITYRWFQFEPTIATQVKLIDRVPTSATIYPIVYEDVMLHHPEQRILAHVASYSTIFRETVPGDFWYNLLEERNPVTQPKFDSRKIPSTGTLDTLGMNFDYLWCYRLQDGLLDSLELRFRPIGEQDSAILMQRR